MVAGRVLLPQIAWFRDVRSGLSDVNGAEATGLARLLGMGDLTVVTVPSVEQEAARIGPGPGREECPGDLRRAWRRLSMLLLRNGQVWDGWNA